MKRRFRLTKSTEFQRVRRLGKSYAHPLIVLICHRNELGFTRWGVVAGKTVGGAVQRNRAKRLLRAGIQAITASVQEGWDLIAIARQPLTRADSMQTQEALIQLLQRAHLMREVNDR